jgi:hypothetical protein
MERLESLGMMSTLKLSGMRAAYDEVVANGIRRQHSVARIIGDLLKAEIAEKQARPVRTRIAAAQVISGLCRGRGGGFANAHHLGDSGQAGPLMVLLRPIDISRHRGRPGLNATVIRIDGLISLSSRACRVVKKPVDIIMQRALIAFQRQGEVAALINDPPGDRALTVERIGRYDRTLQQEHLQQFRNGGDLVGLGVSGDLRQHQTLFAAPGTDHVQRRFTNGAVEGTAQNFAIDRRNTLNCIRKLRHEPLKPGAELSRIEPPEQPTERIVTWNAVLKLEKAAQERLFGFGKPRHRHSALTTTKHSAQTDH